MDSSFATIVEPDSRTGGANFPPTYAPCVAVPPLHAAVDWLSANRLRLLEQLELHGVILFRGFPLGSDEDFDAALRTFELENFPYEGSLSNAIRRHRTERVFTANEAPPEVEIYLHHELAQTPVYPTRLFFFCEAAPESGGATPVCRSDRLLASLRERVPEFVARCERLGVRYINFMPADEDMESGQGRGWCATLGAKNRAEAEARLKSLGYGWSWFDGGVLRACSPALPAVRTLSGGKSVFFNQLIAAWRGWSDSRNEAARSICFGDHSEIPDDDMQAAAEIAEELTVDLAWQVGDMALVDNMQVMHGRRPYSGHRRVLASLAA